MERKGNYKSSLLILPMYPGDNKIFMKCSFLQMVRFDARVKYGCEKFLICPVLCLKRRVVGETEISDK